MECISNLQEMSVVTESNPEQYPQHPPYAAYPQHLAHQQLPHPWRRRAAVTLGAALLAGAAATGAVLATGSTTVTGTAGQSSTAQLPSSSSVTVPGVFRPGGTSTVQTAGDASAQQSSGLVQITSTLTGGVAAGTGIVLGSDGTVVTNHHVVAGATAIKVTVMDTGASYTATYVGGDATTDVAVLKLDGAQGLTTAKLAGTAAQVDDTVTAVGDAGGDGGSLTAAPGTVSGLDQQITVREDSGTSSTLTGLIAMDAYVVPGDSGGAVLNSAGEVVGMNVAASSGTRTVTGFAIPIATVTSVADQILAGSSSSQIALGYTGFLGVALDTTASAPLIAGVERGGAAAGAEIVAGDTITSLDGTTVTTSTQLRQLLAALPSGSRVEVTWTTASGARRSATVTLGQAPIA